MQDRFQWDWVNFSVLFVSLPKQSQLLLRETTLRIVRSIALILIIMGLFSFHKKQEVHSQLLNDPYKEHATNVIYNLLFCDDINLYKDNTRRPYTYPFDILFSKTNSAEQLQKIIDDTTTDPRLRILAYNELRAGGHKTNSKELLAVIVEVGLDSGLDVLASFNNGTARYINQSGKILVWETTTDEMANKLTHNLFANSQIIIKKIGPWDQPRKNCPAKGVVRISFLVSDGLYFGEGPAEVMFNDPMEGPALASATDLLRYLSAYNVNK